jgi:hypothetical protein
MNKRRKLFKSTDWIMGADGNFVNPHADPECQKCLGYGVVDNKIDCPYCWNYDGYHTFDELYHHRTVLFAVICNRWSGWKSALHADGTMYEGYFIVGIDTPKGQATYHCEKKYWELFNVPILDRAPEWDGHTPAEAIERIGALV